MSLEQTVEIPPNRRLFVDVPPEVPVGKVILTFTPLSVSKDLKYAGEIWAVVNRDHPEELKAKLQNLQGSLGKTAYGGMDGAAYQRRVREEWAN
jgi:hypothetical protein